MLNRLAARCVSDALLVKSVAAVAVKGGGASEAGEPTSRRRGGCVWAACFFCREAIAATSRWSRVR